MRGANLLEEIKQQRYFSELTINSIMFQLLSAVAYCHSKGICHRDLKPESVLVSSGKTESLAIKLFDFKTATTFTTGCNMRDSVGRGSSVAPEMERGNYDEKCDVWSCGIFMYTVTCGESPFAGIVDDAILQYVCENQIFFKRIAVEECRTRVAQHLRRSQRPHQENAHLEGEGQDIGEGGVGTPVVFEGENGNAERPHLGKGGAQPNRRRQHQHHPRLYPQNQS